MEHTPEPWHVMDNEATREVFNGCAVIISEHIEDAIIASIGGDVVDCEGNAKVMAAAPDMLAALRIALPFAEEELECREHSYLPEPDKEDQAYIDKARQAVEAIRAAIAKAEGRTC